MLLSLVALPAFVLLLDVPFLRTSGLVAYGLGLSGLIIAIAYSVRGSGWLRYVAVTVCALSLIFTFVLFNFLFREPPARSGVATLSTAAPLMTLPDQDGRPLALADVVRQGPALLVFYRGHW